MTDRRTHHVLTSDGVTIGGTVHGRGPSLVFLQGAIGDGDLDWAAVVGHLADRFTCHLPSVRGRGLSEEHPDLSLARIVDDFVTYVESIGEPVGLTGWSAGGSWSLAAAAQTDAVRVLAPFEPGVLSLMDEQDRAVMVGGVARTGELAATGDLAAAARAFAGFPFDDDEIAQADDIGYFEAAGRYVPDLLETLRRAMALTINPTHDPAVLGAIRAPVVVLVGSDTKPVFAASARYVADHVPDARIREVPGAGHAAPLTHPEALAEALAECFA